VNERGTYKRQEARQILVKEFMLRMMELTMV